MLNLIAKNDQRLFSQKDKNVKAISSITKTYYNDTITSCAKIKKIFFVEFN